jgi:uncharacterized membrane protein required for colicin V production
MSFDVLALALTALLVFLGWRGGLLKQVARLAGVLAVVFGTATAAPIVREALFVGSKAPKPVLEVLSMMLGAVAIYVGVWFISALVIRAVHAVSDTLSSMDHLSGAALGLLKATLVIYFGAVCVAALRGPLEQADPEDSLGLRDSVVISTIAQNDLLVTVRFPDLGRLKQALQTLSALSEQAPKYKDKLLKDPAVAKLLEHEQLSELLKDEELIKKAVQGLFYDLLADKRVQELMVDEDFLKALREVEWSQVSD